MDTFEELIQVVGVDKVLALIDDKIKALEVLKRKIVNQQKSGVQVKFNISEPITLSGYPKEVYDALIALGKPTYPKDIYIYLQRQNSQIKDYNVRQALSTYKDRYFEQLKRKGPWTVKK